MHGHGLVLPFEGVMPAIAEDAFIAPTATVIGKTAIGSRSSIWYGCVLRGDCGTIEVGGGTNLQDNTVVHITEGVADTFIGSTVLVGHSCLLHGCTLEDGCFIGMGATVMDNAVVETGAMVAAGSLVTPGKRIGKGELWAGNPAKYWRGLRDEEVAQWPEQCAHYAEMAERHIKSIGG